MNHHYEDIRSRIAEPPAWWDEYAVPRWGVFCPRDVADVYAREVVFLRIICQNCGHAFDVAMSQGYAQLAVNPKLQTLAEQVKNGWIHYGDPPNIYCCAAGPTMNSEPREVLEFWRLDERHEWQRVPELEIEFPEESEPQ